jgi:hypothetical protein
MMKRLSVDIAGAARGSPLIAEADLHDLRNNTRRILASIHFHQEEEPVNHVVTARHLFSNAASNIGELIDLLSPAETIQAGTATTETYRPNTAFVMMAIDRAQPELEDIKNSIKDICKEFGITAITADEIEHESAITERILEEITTNEFLIADLTGERPNVYYEIGHAHAAENVSSFIAKSGPSSILMSRTGTARNTATSPSLNNYSASGWKCSRTDPADANSAERTMATQICERSGHQQSMKSLCDEKLSSRLVPLLRR